MYVGKFQPFHIGHFAVVEHIASAPDIDEIVIAIGSSQWNWQNRNPERPWLDNIFTWQERKEIIEKSLEGAFAKKTYVIPIFDFLPKWGSASTPKWFNFIRDHCPEFHRLYTNREREVKLFSAAGYETRPHPLKYAFSATCVREKMALAGIWQPFVCKKAVPIIEKTNGPKRAAELFANSEIYLSDYTDLDWEWRTFDSVLPKDVKTILDLPAFKKDEIIYDHYLFSLVRTSVNFKLRKNGFKVKKLLSRGDGLEMWASFDCDFPVDRDWLVNSCRDIKFPLPENLPGNITGRDLISEIPRTPNPYLFLVSLEKKRSMHLFRDGRIRCGIDISHFKLGGSNFSTVGFESKSREELEATFRKFGFERYKRMNYLQFLENFICGEEKDAHPIWQKL